MRIGRGYGEVSLYRGGVLSGAEPDPHSGPSGPANSKGIHSFPAWDGVVVANTPDGATGPPKLLAKSGQALAAAKKWGAVLADRAPFCLCARSLLADAGQFLVIGDVDDLELLGVEPGVGAEGEFAEVALLHLNEVLLVLGAEAFEDGGMHHDA